MDTRTPTWNEVERTVKSARSASAPGPDGLQFRFYRNTPGVLGYLWKVAWQKGYGPRAGGIMIPKEENSTAVNHFHQISLLNVEGKIFSVPTQRLSVFLQKAGI